MLLQTQSDLDAFCRALAGVPYLAVDTEFVRDRTYFAKLCLVQVAHGDHAAAIDPLVPDLDLTPLWALLHDPSILKVFHAAEQDLEILLRLSGRLPAPAFDTQLAATVCGHGDRPGYATLVKALLDVDLDKASQTTDWALRPLTDRQVTYALGDVTWLCQVYERLRDELAATGRGAWIADELAALSDPDRFVPDPDAAWMRLRVRRPTARTLVVLRALAAWREKMAVRRDLPRAWVARDDALVEIAEHLPEDADALARVRSIKPAVAHGGDGRAILATVAKALATPRETWPDAPVAPSHGAGHDALVHLLGALLALRCDAHGVSRALVASRDDLDTLAADPSADVPCASGWRAKVFGDEARRLLAGDLTAAVVDGAVAFAPR